MENVSKRRREPPSLRPISPLMSPFPNESFTQALWDADQTAESEAQERAKLADELRAEQEAAQGLEHDRKDLETRAHEMQVSLDEAEANAIKWGRKMVAKLETR